MARSSFGKLSRDRDKKAKAQAKRERRQAAAEAVADEPVAERDGRSTEDLLQELEELHRQYDAGALGLDDFEERKADLLGRLSVD